MKTVPPFTSIVILLILTSVTSGSLLSMMVIAYGQQPTANGNAVIGSHAPRKPLPVLLVHGYLSDAAIWNKWQALLKKDGIPAFAITIQ
jgi:hypothetical protein